MDAGGGTGITTSKVKSMYDKSNMMGVNTYIKMQLNYKLHLDKHQPC